ncbi:MAG TPA: ATP-binding cassette domain-containing protein, partial [Candidatus Paceibacterota bacterium]
MAKGKESKGAQTFAGDTIIRFDEVSFEYGHNKPILDEVTFNVRRGTKVTIMGQNGAGKSTLFGLILGAAHEGEGHQPTSGEIFLTNGTTVAAGRQTIPRDQLDLTVREFFAKAMESNGRPKVYDLDPRIDEVLDVVNLHALKATPKNAAAHPELTADLKDRVVKSFSGGQQARLLLASALIQNPDILLLDEPTNNLDKAGIEHLTKFLIEYKKTCLVISHDAEFLNSFTHGVLYLDVHTRKIEQYVGDYKDVVDQIAARIEKENMENARLQKEIQAKKDQAGVFAMKGGGMRLVAKRMRQVAEELEEEIVEVRKEDKTIRPFTIPAQPDLVGEVVKMTEYSMISPTKHTPVTLSCNIGLRKKTHLLLAGPNGIGKSTLLGKIMEAAQIGDDFVAKGKTVNGITIAAGMRVGYYRQDFSMMDFNDTVYQSLEKV